MQALYTRPYHYLSRAQMAQFVAEASAALFDIYRLIFRDGWPIGDRRTSLALLAPRAS